MNLLQTLPLHHAPLLVFRLNRGASVSILNFLFRRSYPGLGYVSDTSLTWSWKIVLNYLRHAKPLCDDDDDDWTMQLTLFVPLVAAGERWPKTRSKCRTLRRLSLEWGSQCRGWNQRQFVAEATRLESTTQTCCWHVTTIQRPIYRSSTQPSQ